MRDMKQPMHNRAPWQGNVDSAKVLCQNCRHSEQKRTIQGGKARVCTTRDSSNYLRYVSAELRRCLAFEAKRKGR